MAKTANKSKNKKSDDLPVSEHVVFAIVILVSFLLAPLSSLAPEPLRFFVVERFGVFENATVLFYALALGLGLKTVYEHRGKSWKSLWPVILISVLAFVFIGEEFRWGLPWALEDAADRRILSLQDLFALSYEGVPKGAELDMIAAIAITRFTALMGVLYGIGAVIYFSKTLIPAVKKHIRHPSVFYVLAFLTFGAFAVLMDADILPGRHVYEECLEMCAALALFFCLWGIIKNSKGF